MKVNRLTKAFSCRCTASLSLRSSRPLADWELQANTYGIAEASFLIRSEALAHDGKSLRLTLWLQWMLSG